MKIKYNDKTVENEINSFIDLVLHLDSFLFKGQIGLEKLNKKISKLNLIKNTIDVIQEIIPSEKASYYICNDEKIIEIRNNQGLKKAINEIFKKEQGKEETKQIIRKINTFGFNQTGLLNSHTFYSSEAEFYFLKNFIHTKILGIVKSIFENEFNKKQIVKSKKIPSKKKTNFILISHSCLKNAKLINEYILHNQRLSLTNNFIRLTNSRFLNPANFRYLKKSLSRSQPNIFENYSNSNIFSLYKNMKNTSKANTSDYNVIKNSSSSCDKSSNKLLDINTMNISNNKKNNFFRQKNIKLLDKRKNEAQEKAYFLPILSIKDNTYKRKLRFKRKNVPSFHSEKMELISYNTKNNIKIKNEETFLNECIKESYRSLRDISNFQQIKCFVDYSKSSIMSDKLATKKNEEASPKEKVFFPGFEYKSIYRYTFNGKLPRTKVNTTLMKNIENNTNKNIA